MVECAGIDLVLERKLQPEVAQRALERREIRLIRRCIGRHSGPMSGDARESDRL
jgi:hypothetical protein